MLRKPTVSTTRIPHTELNQILQSKLSPSDIVALLNKTERLYLEKPLHLNSKYQFPFWKQCHSCNTPFQTHNATQAIRNITCSESCAKSLIAKANTGKKVPPCVCQECQIEFYPKTNQSIQKFCSRICAGKDKKKNPKMLDISRTLQNLVVQVGRKRA